MIIQWTISGDAEKIFKEVMSATGLSEEVLLSIFFRVGIDYFVELSQGRELVIKDKATGKEIGRFKPPRGKFKSVIRRHAPRALCPRRFFLLISWW